MAPKSVEGFYAGPGAGIKPPPSLFGAIFLQNHLEGKFVKIWLEKRGGKFRDFVNKNGPKKGGIARREFYCKKMGCKMDLTYCS